MNEPTGDNNEETTTSNTQVVKPVNASSKQSSISKIASAVFPIQRCEMKKFLLMGAIKFFVIMALTLTRDTKDTLVVTQCGAEAIAFLKVRVCYCFFLLYV
jgi:AAA family ATP:ADP antiporter